jgi:hypothetical protein
MRTVRCARAVQAEERETLNADLTAILGGAMPRRLGEPPAATGLFSRVVPSPEWDALLVKSGGAKNKQAAAATAAAAAAR